MSSTRTVERVRLNRRQVKNRITVALWCLGVLVLSFLYAPWANEGPVLCPTRLVFGIPCPGCGLTRSFCAMTRGHIAEALSYHLYGPGVFVGCVLAVPWMIAEAMGRRRLVLPNRVAFSMKAGYLLGGGLILYHTARLAHLALSGQLLPAVNASLIGTIGHLAAAWLG